MIRTDKWLTEAMLMKQQLNEDEWSKMKRDDVCWWSDLFGGVIEQQSLEGLIRVFHQDQFFHFIAIGEMRGSLRRGSRSGNKKNRFLRSADASLFMTEWRSTVFFTWWRWGGSNPCPETVPHTDVYSLSHVWIIQQFAHELTAAECVSEFSCREAKRVPCLEFHWILLTATAQNTLLTGGCEPIVGY